MTKKEFESFADRCRIGLEQLPVSRRSISFKSFPSGSCGDSTDLLGMLLLERAGISSQYVLGTNHPQLSQHGTHAWLEVDGYIIDITHDQFDGTGLTGWVHEHSPWHAKFKREVRPLSLEPHQWFQFPSLEYQAMKAALDGQSAA